MAAEQLGALGISHIFTLSLVLHVSMRQILVFLSSERYSLPLIKTDLVLTTFILRNLITLYTFTLIHPHKKVAICTTWCIMGATLGLFLDY